jgi:hypothetical protein
LKQLRFEACLKLGDLAADGRDRSSVGPISLSEIGTFVAESVLSYEDRVASILRIMVDAAGARETSCEKI